MSVYRRAKCPGGLFFFTLTLADRRETHLTDQIGLLRDNYRLVCERHPFETISICVLPDHLHAIRRLPEGDSDFSTRWNLIKGKFSRGVVPTSRLSASKIAKREKGIWQRRFWEHAIRDETDLARHVDLFISTRSSTAMSAAFAIGRTAAFIASLHAAISLKIGEGI